MLQNLRIGHKKRRNRKSDVPVKQRGGWPKHPKIKEKHRTAFFSLSENWCLPAPSTLKPEEREFVVHSGASMHMISRKDLNSAELETVSTSRSPTTVVTANGEVHTNEEVTFYVKEMDIFLTLKSSRTRQQFYRWDSFSMNTDTHTSGSTVKNHISLKTVFGYSAIRRTSFRSWFLVCQRVLPQACPLQHPGHPSRHEVDHPKSSSSSSTSPPMTSSTVSSESVARQERGDPCGIGHHPAIVSSERVEMQERGEPCPSETSEELLTKPTKIPKPNNNKNHDRERGETRAIPKYRNGCKNSERILWMTEILNTETHTHVLLMDHL